MVHSPYILIAEDDEDDRMLLSSAFKEYHIHDQIIFVNNGVEVLRHFEKIESGNQSLFPSLLVLDLNMPKINGKQVLSELNIKSYFKSFNTVMFSTTSCENEVQNCIDLGISKYFVKPTGYQALLDVVNQFCLLAGFVKAESNS
ncbi:MAG: response regulator [Crocinitomicaceae bacterium]|nr:response regulator [Crocinitomicaceae bacterium]